MIYPSCNIPYLDGAPWR